MKSGEKEVGNRCLLEVLRMKLWRNQNGIQK
jgi:hypothetical protein